MRIEPIIKVSKINHYYGTGQLRKQILFDISTEIQAGEIVIVTGPSGSGKTTLLTLIGALRSVQEGSLTVLGQELNRANNKLLENVRKNIGFIFQAHNLLTSLTASQNVQMSLALHGGISKREAERKAQAILEMVRLGERVNYYPNQMSGGQKQRVAIARALVTNPSVILADEPTAALDKKSGRDVVEMLQYLAKQQGCAILLVTHDNRILDVADRIISLEDGFLTSSKNTSSNNSHRLASLKGELINHVEDLSLKDFLSLLQQVTGEFQSFLSLIDNEGTGKCLEEVIEAITLRITHLLQAERSTIFIVDDTPENLWSEIIQSNRKKILKVGITAHFGVAAHVAATRECLNIPIALQDYRYSPAIDEQTGYQTRNILCLPILNSQSKVLAISQVLNKIGNNCFDRKDEQLLGEFSQQISAIFDMWCHLQKLHKTSITGKY
ncbi:ATP-binding cassette domain-containing protein [Nostoc muscorum FACHB-395]|nr:ATP-binding cassette domain-containing protein [Desmonostoc muscorum FACHB-395]